MSEKQESLPPKTYTEWQQSVIDEADELNLKLKKLLKFISAIDCDKDPLDLDFMRIQAGAMTSYLSTLLARISRF